jgi:hypothetical protein
MISTRSVTPCLFTFFINDLYYPRPDPNDLLYVQFETGYLSVYPQDATDLGEASIFAYCSVP